MEVVRLSNVLSSALGLEGEEGVFGELEDGVFELGGSCAGISQPCLPGMALVWSWSPE